MDDDKKCIFKKLSSEVMSDEESGDDGELILRHLTWRSEAADQLIKKIIKVHVQTGVQKARIIGPVSERQPSDRIPRELII